MRFEAQKGQRLHRYFIGVEVGGDQWWNCTLLLWEPLGTSPGHDYSTGAPCRTLKAFKRMLRKNPVIKGRSRLVNRYVGFDVFA